MRDAGAVQMRFGPDDEDEFAITKAALIEEFRPWADERYGADDGSLVADADTFLSWRFNYSDGDLTTFDVPDADEFLLGWAPRKFAVSSDEAPTLCRSVQAMVEFLADTDRLDGGFGRAARVMTHVDGLVDEVAEALDDPKNFGLGKSIFGVDLLDASGSPLPSLAELFDDDRPESMENLQALLDERMQAFNSLPFDERRALTDPMFERMLPEPIELPFVFVPPSEAEVEASAEDSELLRQVDGLVRHLGDSGIKLTQAGNVRLADARELVEALATGDEIDPMLWGRENKTRSSTQLEWLHFITLVAEQADAVDWLKTKMNPSPDWLELPLTVRAAAVVEAALDVGVTSFRYPVDSLFGEIVGFLEAGIPHWFTVLLPAGTQLDHVDLVDEALAVTARQYDEERTRWKPKFFDQMIEGDLSRLLENLERVGIIEWTGRTEIDDPDALSPSYEGGTIVLTPLGRLTMSGRILDAGYTFATIDDLATADAIVLVNAVLTMSVTPEHGLEQWRPEASVGERARLLADAALHADLAEQRLAVFTLFRSLGPAGEVGPVVRELLDSPLAGHAAMYLLDRGLATEDDVGMFVDVGPLVDMLATVTDEPEALDELFRNVQAQAIDDLIDDMWRHDQPETIEVLEALGRSLTDKALAKAARKAAIRHRSWLANQR